MKLKESYSGLSHEAMDRLNSNEIKEDNNEQNDKDLTEEDIDPLFKPINMPIQEIKMNKKTEKDVMEELEKNSWRNKDINFKPKLRGLIRYNNPIYANDPLFKNEKPPEVYAFGLTDDRESFATGYSNGEIHLNKKGETYKVIQYSRDTILALKFHPKYNYIIITINSIGDVVHTHVPSAKKLSEFKIENKIPRCMDLSKRGEKMCVGFTDGEINIYDESTQTLEKNFRSGTSYANGHINQVHSVMFNKNDENRLISSGQDRRIILWDIRQSNPTNIITEPFIMGDSLDIKENYVIAGSYETKQGVLLYDVRKFNKSLQSFRTDSQIYTCKFSKKENEMKFAAGGYRRNVIKIYSVDKSDFISGIDGCDSPVYALDFNNIGTVLGYGCGDGGIRLVDI